MTDRITVFSLESRPWSREPGPSLILNIKVDFVCGGVMDSVKSGVGVIDYDRDRILMMN